MRMQEYKKRTREYIMRTREYTVRKQKYTMRMQEYKKRIREYKFPSGPENYIAICSIILSSLQDLDVFVSFIIYNPVIPSGFNCFYGIGLAKVWVIIPDDFVPCHDVICLFRLLLQGTKNVTTKYEAAILSAGTKQSKKN